MSASRPHLSAAGTGLGGCWVGAFDEGGGVRDLCLPVGGRPVALVPIGWPAEAPSGRSRKDLREVVSWVEG